LPPHAWDPSLVVITGPTAVGKTPAAVSLARQIGAEIVCADSRAIYRGMNIGTAKPTPTEQALVPHHVLDVARPDDVVTVADYQRLAEQAIAGIARRGRLPLMVGGTGLYIRAVVDGLQIPPTPPDWELRAALEAEERADGPGTLYRRLQNVDPAAASRIHPRNVRRVIRALEVHAWTGTPISAFHGSGGGPLASARRGTVAMIALNTDRDRLYARIHRRIDQQLAAGLVAEVSALLQIGYAKTLPALQGLGYKEIISHLEGRLSLAEARALFQRHTRRYAKRQLTWIRGDERYAWLDVGDDPPEVVAERIRAMISV
jgi:tRNA dimethylallyltransferase